MKKTGLVLITFALLTLLGWAGTRALRSDLFRVKIVEVSGLSIEGAIDPELLIERAKIPVGKAQIFDLDLEEIEQRLQGNPWIKRIRIERRLPHTIAICPELRVPVALLQDERGILHYIDAELTSFGPVRAGVNTDLPLLSSSVAEFQKQEEAFLLMQSWQKAGLADVGRLEEIHYREDVGFSVLVMYPGRQAERVKTWVELGESYDQDGGKVFARLKKAIAYLSREGLNTRSIMTDIGKKIVVKFARGS